MFWEVYALDRQEYLKSLTEQIRTKRARTMVAEEVEAHIEDQKQDFMAHGLGEEEAESMAVVEMGDPVEAGVKLDRVHRPKMEWTVLMAILVISIMGLILQAVVTSSFPTMNMSTLEAFKDNFLYGGIWSAMLIGIVMSLNMGAFMSESIRGALLSVDEGQKEAAYSLGMTNFQLVTRIVIPQAVRIALPPLFNDVINLIKMTSLAFMLGVPDVMGAAKIEGARTFRYFEIYAAVMLIYWVIIFVLGILHKLLEKKCASMY